MVNNRPTVYNTASVYKESGGGGDRPEPPLGFELVGAVYWNNTLNAFTSSGFTLDIKGTNNGTISQKIYKPNAGKQNATTSLFILGDWNNKYCYCTANTYINSIGIKNNSTTKGFTKDVTSSGIHEIVLNKNNCSFDTTSFTDVAYTEINNVGYCFPFPINDRYKPDPIFAMYEFKIVDSSNNLKSYIIPVKRIADGLVGIMDVISGRTYLDSKFSYYTI